MTVALTLPASPVTLPVATGAAAKHAANDDFTFDDLISIVNPLQHIPVVSTVYRAVTGDTIKPFERILGDTLYGGMWGMVSSVANVVYEDVTGKDFGQTVLDFVMGNDDAPATRDGSSPMSDAAATPASINSAASTAAVQPASLPATGTIPAEANGPPRALQAPKSSASTDDAAMLALLRSLSNKGVDPALGQRAVSAYKKSLQAKPQEPTQNPTPPAAQIPTS
ncbi:MAG TPA: hypothetical protein VMU22_04495 [Rhizomicrobium sp.]|nr:hypothetical protein [Rhizomicrobium sp.]